MSQSIKLNDNNFIDAEGVYDRTEGKVQSSVNAGKTNLYTISITATDLENFLTQLAEYANQNGTGVYQGQWNEHDQFVGVIRKADYYYICGMIQFSISDPKIYVVARTPSTLNYRQATLTSI